MTSPADTPDDAPHDAHTTLLASAPPAREVIYRHTLLVRLSHWVNALVIFLMIGSGLNIFNAHPRLYWGLAGDQYDRALLSIGPAVVHGVVRGVTQIGDWRIDTTGVLGWSKSHGTWSGVAWPVWLTIPSFRDLADARHWHFFFAWVLAANGALYLIWSLVSRHLQRDLWPTLADMRSIPHSVAEHLRNRHPTGEAAKRCNVLHRLAYLGLIGLVVGMVTTGLALSPGVDAFARWLPALLGGRQTARTLHFICMSGIVAFIVVHLAEVVLAGPINEIGSMITGRYRVPADHSAKGQ